MIVKRTIPNFIVSIFQDICSWLLGNSKVIAANYYAFKDNFSRLDLYSGLSNYI